MVPLSLTPKSLKNADNVSDQGYQEKKNAQDDENKAA